MKEEISALLDKWYDELNELEDEMQFESSVFYKGKYERLKKCIEELEVIYQNLLKEQWKAVLGK